MSIREKFKKIREKEILREVSKSNLERELEQNKARLIRETERIEYYITASSNLYSRSKTTGNVTLIKDLDNGNGYRYAFIDKKNEYIHRLVAEAFIAGFKSDLQINHIDGDRANNNLNNLELCTAKQNSEHRAVTKHFDNQIVSVKDIKQIQRIKQTDSINDVVNALDFNFVIHEILEEFTELEIEDKEAIELINSFKNKKEA